MPGGSPFKKPFHQTEPPQVVHKANPCEEPNPYLKEKKKQLFVDPNDFRKTISPTEVMK
jgi:hypothetical protein